MGAPALVQGLVRGLPHACSLVEEAQPSIRDSLECKVVTDTGMCPLSTSGFSKRNYLSQREQ